MRVALLDDYQDVALSSADWSTLPADTEVRVWDSTAEIRYVTIPRRPAGTEHLDEVALRALVTRDSLVGVRVLDGAPNGSAGV